MREAARRPTDRRVSVRARGLQLASHVAGIDGRHQVDGTDLPMGQTPPRPVRPSLARPAQPRALAVARASSQR